MLSKPKALAKPALEPKEEAKKDCKAGTKKLITKKAVAKEEPAAKIEEAKPTALLKKPLIKNKSGKKAEEEVETAEKTPPPAKPSLISKPIVGIKRKMPMGGGLAASLKKMN